MIDPYASCPCGSGKKFKWCCQAFHEDVEKALWQLQNGQHEAALQTIEAVAAAHPRNPEVLGRKAQILHALGRKEDAEKSLEEAFGLNPNYAFGYLLQGLLRSEEKEEQGAILLFRKATETYAADAADQLSFLFEHIGAYEMQRNNVVAARYAFDRCQRLQPNNQELRAGFEASFGDQARMPYSARRGWKLQGAEPKRPTAWHDAHAKAGSGKLSEAAKAFEALAKEPKADPLASFNAGLLRAWLGDNVKALEHLEKYVEKESKEELAVEAWALAEVLRFGEDLAAQADYVQHRRMFRFGNPSAVGDLLRDWETSGRLVGARQLEDGVISALVLEETTGLIGAAAPPAAPLGAYLIILGDVVQAWHPNPASVEKIVLEIKQKLGTGILEEKDGVTEGQFGDTVVEALVFPTYGKATPEYLQKSTERAEHFFEEVWIHRPLKSLAGNAPIDAAGHGVLRRKVLGIVRFLEECFTGGTPAVAKDGKLEKPTLYNFDRLRHKLGLDTAPPPPQIDFASMNAAELAALDLDLLTIDQLDKAFRAAVALDARELAARFVRTIIARPVDPARPDLFVYFKFLIDQAQSEADWDGALRVVDEGIAADAARNSGLRQADFELRRGQLLAKKGDAEKAALAFETLIQRLPGELRFRGSAAEAMLSARQGKRAVAFAEGGLAEARRAANRDQEAYFQELVAAAKRQA